MSVTGDNDGIPCDNKKLTRTEPLISVAKLKQNYLFGIEIKDKAGNELPKSSFEQYIANAVSMFEHYLDIAISPILGFEENRDYHLNDYAEWGFMYLHNYPVIRIQKLEMIFFRDAQGLPEVVQEIPNNWIRLQRHDGILRLIPNARFPANLQISNTGNYFPEILRTETVPSLWRITYDYGFEDGKIPTLLNQAIGYLAAIQALIVGGNLVLGAGIAGSSISIDGLSQSIQTTQSAENSAFSATIKDYGDKLFGSTKDDPFAIIKTLKNYYKGQGMDLL